jgi:hypothetical protein
MLCWIEVYHREFLLSNVDNTLEARIIPAFMSSDLFRNALRNVFGTLESYTFIEVCNLFVKFVGLSVYLMNNGTFVTVGNDQ